jgi:hypothetical protein
MSRSSGMALAALLFAAAMSCAPTKASAGGWEYYGGRFLALAQTEDHASFYAHEYSAFNPGCAWLRRVVPTPLGLRWRLVPICF